MPEKKTVSLLITIAAVAALFLPLCSRKEQTPQKEATPAARNTTSVTPQPQTGNNTTQPAETSVPETASGTDKHKVIALSGLDTVTAIVEGTPGQLLVFDLYADWCRPCKLLAPMYDSLAETHGHTANFYRVDVQRNPDIAAAFGVRGIPLVVFMKDKEVVQALSGLNPRTSYERILTSCGEEVSVEECRENLNKAL